jgi:hypothetical protein
MSVELVDPVRQLLVGDTARLEVRVSSGGAPMASAAVEFTSSDESVLVADPSGLLIGVGEGEAQVTARLIQFASAAPASTDVVVSRGIVIQSLLGQDTRNTSVRFGEILEVTGLRLDPDSLAAMTIGSVPVEVAEYVPADPQDPESRERLHLIVPIAGRDSDLLLVHQNRGSASRRLEVIQEDILERAQGAPPTFDLADGPFYAPQLMVGYPDSDWYRFRFPEGEYTVELALKSGYSFIDAGQFLFEFRTPSSPNDGFPPWNRGPITYGCEMPGRYRGIWRAPMRGGLPVLKLALQFDEPTEIDFLATTEWGFLIPHRLQVSEGYQSELPPDDTEGNDFCFQAAPLELGAPPKDLTFDVAGDYDWYEVEVPGVRPTWITNHRNELEPNNSVETAELIEPSTRMVGEKATINDVDFFAVDLTAGAFLDVDARASLLRTPAPGKQDRSDMLVDLRLYDPQGNLLDISGFAASVPREYHPRGSDARIRYVVPTSGRYYLSVTGESTWSGDPDFGSLIYYQMDVMVHELAGYLNLTAVGADVGADPEVLLLEQRPSGENVLLDRWDAVGMEESFSVPVPAGPYFVMVYNALPVPGAYSLSTTVAPGAAAGASGNGGTP